MTGFGQGSSPNELKAVVDIIRLQHMLDNIRGEDHLFLRMSGGMVGGGIVLRVIFMPLAHWHLHGRIVAITVKPCTDKNKELVVIIEEEGVTHSVRRPSSSNRSFSLFLECYAKSVDEMRQVDAVPTAGDTGPDCLSCVGHRHLVPLAEEP